MFLSLVYILMHGIHILVCRAQGDAVRQSVQGSRSDFEAALNDITWSPDAVTSLQSTISNGVLVDLCLPQNTSQVYMCYVNWMHGWTCNIAACTIGAWGHYI